jgi:hypothetical protein
VTVYYEHAPSYPKSASAPTEIGSYNVTFDVAAAAGYNAASGLPVGTLVIKAPEEGQRPPVFDDFIVDGLGVKDYLEGEVYYAIKVTVKDAADGNPLITPYYGGRSDVPGVKADAVGTHVVRFTVAAGGNFLSGDVYAGTITITQGEEINQGNISKYFDISGLSQVYANTSREVKITPKYDYAFLSVSKIYTGTGATRYGPSSSAPSASGTYAVTFGVSGGGFKSVNNLQAGTLTIDTAAASPGTLTIGDFDVADDNPWNTKYNLSKNVVISVNPIESKKGDIGVITVKYLRRDEPGPATDYPPSRVGYYTVTFDVTASVRYGAITLPAGTLHINKADDPIEQWQMETVGIGDVTYDGQPKSVSIYIPHLDYRAPENRVWYNGSSTPPTDADEYDVTFDIILDDIWAGESRISAGKLNITPRYPARSDFGNASLTNKTYNNRAATVAPPAGASGVVPNYATKGLAFKKSGDAAAIPGAPVNAGTYAVYLTLANDDKNWHPTEGDGIPLGQELVISKRDAIEADFEPTAASKLDQFAYDITQPQFVRVQGRPEVDYPTTTAFRADFYLSAAATAITPLTTVQTNAPRDYEVRINLPTNLENWNGGQLRWRFTAKDNIFTSIDEFVDWYNKRRAGNTVYVTKFKDGVLVAADIKRIALALKDVGEYTTGANTATTHPEYWESTTAGVTSPPRFITTNNANKRLNLDLSGSALPAGVTSLAGPDGGFKDCANLRVLNLIGSSVATLDVDNSFAGCTNLEELRLPNSVTSLGANAAASVIASLNNLIRLELVGAVTPFTTDYLGPTMALNMLTVDKVAFAAKSFESSKVRGLTMTSSTATLAADAFLNSMNLASVVFPDAFGTNVIGARAFKGCKALSNVHFPGTTWATAGTIDDGAFEGCSSLQTVSIPVIPAVAIHANAFGGADAVLTTLTLGGASGLAGAILQDTQAFAGKENLRTVNLGVSITALTASSVADTTDTTKPGLFEGCTRLRTVNWPTGTGFLTIGTRAFKGCTALITNIPSSVTTIGESAFDGCTSIENITLPTGVGFTTIANKAFRETALTSLTIPQNVTAAIGDYAFENCRSLARVTLLTGTTPAAVPGVGSTSAGSSFAGCYALNTFGLSGNNLPATGVCAIPAIASFTVRPNSFKDTAFSSIVVDSVAATVIAGDAFTLSTGRTSNIATLEFKGTMATGADFGTGKRVPSINTVIWGITDMIADYDFSGTGVTKLVVKAAIAAGKTILGVFPDTLTTLELNTADQLTDEELFGALTNLKTVIIGTTGNTAGDPINVGATSTPTNDIFPTSVKTITFTGKVGTLGGKFSNNLTTGLGTPASPYLTFRFEGATGVIAGNAAVFGADNIQVVEIVGNGVTEVTPATNFDSTTLVAINVIGNNDKYGNYNSDGILYGKNAQRVLETLIRYPAAKDDVDEYTTPSMVTRLGVSAFSGNTAIETLNISQNIAYIAATVFDNMSGLETVNYNARALVATGGLDTTSTFPNTVTEVNISEGVTNIPACFAGTAIEEIIIPESVTVMAINAFAGCEDLETVKFYARECSVDSSGAFSGLGGASGKVANLEIGNNVKIIPNDTFKETDIVLPITLRNIVTIGSGAFEGCAKLSGAFDISATCTSIGATAFLGTTSITGFYIRGEGVTMVDSPAAQASFRQAGGSGDQLATLYADNGPGYFSWKNDATPANVTWVFTAIP